MSRTSMDMTRGSLKKQILFFSIPLMLSNLLQVLFNMSDIAVIGQFAGAMSLGAVGSTTTLISMYTGFLIGLSGGINVLTALYIGARNRKSVSETVHSAFLVSLAVGLILLILGVSTSRGVLVLLNTKEELIDKAALYIRIYFLGIPALALYNFGNAVFSAAGDTGRPLRYLFLSGIVNVILNLFFVIVCKLDVVGVALASALSQCLSAFLIVMALFRSHEDFGLHLAKAPAFRRISAGDPAARDPIWFSECDLRDRKSVCPARRQFFQCRDGSGKFRGGECGCADLRCDGGVLYGLRELYGAELRLRKQKACAGQLFCESCIFIRDRTCDGTSSRRVRKAVSVLIYE